MCLSNFKVIRQFKVPISWLRDFTRSYEKTSFRILRRGPGRFSTMAQVLACCVTAPSPCLNQFWLSNVYLVKKKSREAVVCLVNTLRPRQNGCHCADDSFKCIFMDKNTLISIEISVKSVSKGPVNNIQCQAIIWTNDSQIPDAYMRHSASVGWVKSCKISIPVMCTSVAPSWHLNGQAGKRQAS